MPEAIITREKIEQRLAELNKGVDQLKADLNAMMGAIQDCQYWLSMLDGAKTETEEKK